MNSRAVSMVKGAIVVKLVLAVCTIAHLLPVVEVYGPSKVKVDCVDDERHVQLFKTRHRLGHRQGQLPEWHWGRVCRGEVAAVVVVVVVVVAVISVVAVPVVGRNKGARVAPAWGFLPPSVTSL
jgi:hypothetical protein